MPDVAVVAEKEVPRNVLSTAPLIAIEILAEDDRFADLANRAGDFARMSVEHVWLLDAAARTAYVYLDGGWRVARELRVAGSPVSLDLGWLRGRVDAVLPSGE